MLGGALLALRAALMIISFVLALGPIVYGLYEYNWNIDSYIATSIPSEVFTSGAFPSISFKSVEAEQFGAGAFVLILHLEVDNQMNTSFTVYNITFDVYCSDHNMKLASAYMESSVTIPAGSVGDVPIKIVGTFDGYSHVVNYHSYTYTDPVSGETVYVVSFNSNLEDGTAKFGLYQVEMQMPFEYSGVSISFEYGGG